MRLKDVAKQGVRVDAAAPCGKPRGHICLCQSHDMEIVYGPLLQLPRSFVKITNQTRGGHHRGCQMQRQQARRILWPITAAPDHVCKHLLYLAIGGLVVAGQLRLWASESCSTC